PPPYKKSKMDSAAGDANDSFDDDDLILDGPSERFEEVMSQHVAPQSVSVLAHLPRPAPLPQRPDLSQSNRSTVPLPTRPTVTPGQSTMKTTPTSSRTRPSAFQSSRSAASTPTSSHGSQNMVSQGELIAVQFQLSNVQREKEQLGFMLAKATEEFNSQKKQMEMERQKELKKMQDRLKMAEGAAKSFQISQASQNKLESSMVGDDLNQSMNSLSGSSQRKTVRQAHSVPQFGAGNGFKSDIASTFTHNQTVKMEGEISFQDIPSQAFETPRMDILPILTRLPSPVQKVETADEKIQTEFHNEVVSDLRPSSLPIESSLSTVLSCLQPDEDLFSLLATLVRDPIDPDFLEIGENRFTPPSSQINQSQ
ncbi:hypothetical protein PFISCL1PPCAC_15362, partial [Pristionchus fissidentatus]